MWSGLTSVAIAMGVMLAMAQGVATPGASPVAGGDWNMDVAAGTAFDLLTPAPAGTVEVVAVGELKDGAYPVIVHNNTGDVIDRVRVEAVAFDGSGDLYAVADAATVSPGRIEPQGIGMGSASFGDLMLPAGGTIETLVRYEAPTEGGAFGSMAPEVIESSWAQGRILGIISNPHEQEITDLRVSVACIADDGSIQMLSTTSTSASVLPVGGTVAFQVLPGDGPPCAGELIVADGRT